MKVLILKVDCTLPKKEFARTRKKLFTQISEGFLLLDNRISYSIADIDAAACTSSDTVRECTSTIKPIIDFLTTLINTALGIELYDWQKEFIFCNKKIPPEIENHRKTGTTTARAIKACIALPKSYFEFDYTHSTSRDKILEYAGNDIIYIGRQKNFIEECRKIYIHLKPYLDTIKFFEPMLNLEKEINK